MAKSIRVITKRRGRPKTTGKGELVGVRILPDLMEALDRYIAEEAPGATRPEAVRTLLKDGLISLGLLKLPE